MKPIRVVMSAFGSYAGEETVNFDTYDHGIFLITGDTGAGKTTLFDAITYALYDQTSGGKREGEMMRSHYALDDTPTFVEFTFKYQGQIYTIKRNPKYSRASKRRNKDGEIQSTVENPSVELIMPDGRPFEGKVKETNKKIIEIMGLDADQFTQIAMIAQGDFLKLLHAPTRDRKEIFSRIFNTKIYASIQEALRSKGKALDIELHQNKSACSLELERISCVEDSDYAKDWQAEKGFSEIDMSQTMELIRKILDETEAKEQLLGEAIQEKQQESDHIKASVKLGETINTLIDKYESVQSALIEVKEKEPQFATLNTEIERAKKAAIVQRIETAALKERSNQEATSKRITTIQNELISLEEKLTAALDQRDALAKGLSAMTLEINPKIVRIKDSLEVYEQTEKKEDEYKVFLSSFTKLESKYLEQNTAIEALKSTSVHLLQELDRLKNSEADVFKAAQEVKQLEEKEKELRLMAEAVERYESAKKMQDDRAAELLQEQKVYQIKSDAYEHIYADFIHEQVGIIAATLVDGAPCPVCGSVDHPRKAERSVKAISQKQVDDAKLQRNTAEKKLNDATVLYNEIKLVFEKEKDYLQHQGRRLISPEFLLEPGGVVHIRAISESVKEQVISSKTVLTQAQQKLSEFETYSVQLKDTDAKLSQLQVDKEKLETEKKELLIINSQMDAEIKQMKSSLTYASKADALKQLAELDAQLEKGDAALKEAENKYRFLLNTKEKNQGILTTEKVLFDRQKGETEILEASFKETLAQQGFEDRYIYQSAVREDVWIVDAEKKYQDYREKIIKLTEQVKTYKEQQEGKSRVDLIRLKEQEVLTTDQLRQMTEQAKKIFTIKDQNSKAQAKIQRLFTERLALKKKYEVLSTLDKTANGNLSGAAKMDFQTYIQRRYFEHIIHEANKRLQIMSSEQFILRCRDKESLGAQGEVGLDLDVYSLVNDKTRDVKTLSGGESFMSSLAMALGMADVIQNTAGKIHLDTMFIDEGFGSLDDDTREQAIKILNSLAEGKRLVGIISHVTELKDRIHQKLYVTKDEKGSKIYWEQQ